MSKWRAFVFVALCAFFFSLTSVSALSWSNNTFNNSLSSENILFSACDLTNGCIESGQGFNYNLTRYISVPSGVTITNTFFNLTGLNVTGSLLVPFDTETYSDLLMDCTDDTQPSGEMYDGDFGTCGYKSISSGVINNVNFLGETYYVNPDDTEINISSKFYIETCNAGGACYVRHIMAAWNFVTNSFNTIYDSGNIFNDTGKTFNVNATISESLMSSRGVLIIRHSAYLSRQAGSGNTQLKYYETEVIETTGRSNMNETWIEVGTPDGTREWSYDPAFIHDNNKTNNFAAVMNDYLGSCVFVGGYCTVPILFHSERAGYFNYSSMSFNNVGFLENSQTFNNITYESKQETYTLNFTYDSTEYGTATPTANLVYNGTSYAGTKSGTGNTITFSKTLTIDTVTSQQNKSFYWEVILTNSSGANYFNSTTQNQTVNIASLSYCGGAGGSVVYLNFTFLDEGDSSALNATNDLTDFDYWISGGSVTQSYIVTNTTENPEYAFCFVPQDEDVIVDLTFKYASSGYPLRTFQYDDQTLTNTTTNQVLYLLGSSDGIYSTIQATTSLGSPINGATMVVERQFSGTWTTVEQGVTGTDGAATFWVNPNFDHRITATKTGYTATQVIIRPSQSTYTIIMSETTGNATFVSDLPGVKWAAYPHPGSIEAGTYNFNVTVTSSTSNLENCKFELLNATNTSQVLATSTSFTNSTYCQPSFDYTVTANQNFFGRLSLDTTSTTGWVIVDTDWKWVAIDLDKKSWRTITSFFEDLKDLSEFGEGNERDFSRYIFFFMLSTILLSVFFHFSGFEISNPGVSILLIWFIILVASVAGFLSFNSGSDNINSVWEQYAFLLIFSLLSTGYMLNKWRRDSE